MTAWSSLLQRLQMSHSLHIREFPEGLSRTLRVKAFERGIPLREFVIEVLEQATKQQRRAMAVAVEGDAAQKTCAYEPSEGKQKGREVETLNLPESQQASTSEPGQAETRRPSARHDAATHRTLAQRARTGGLSAPPVKGEAQFSHNSKECKIYGCGMCKLSGYKDERRGLQ